ncbi:MAG: hypothetical protein NT079_05080 [Candidatus Omnitrophica bacterium]|nr:hypothetical protein [Candidatus Omnitrophota bacterium]
MEKMALLTAGIIFLIVSILHLIRYLLKLDVKIGEFAIPLWASIFGFLFSLSLAAWMLMLAK